MAMFRHVEVIETWIWGQRVGAVAWDPNRRTHVFEYDPDWWRGGVQLARAWYRRKYGTPPV